MDWEQVWTNVAAQLNGYRDVGLEALLTEDVLRFSTLQQLAGSGLDTRQLEVEWRRPGVSDAVDLVVSGPPRTAVEFKFPREPRATNAAWTQHLGETLKDFYRLASMPADFEDRICVQLLSRRVRRYFDSVTARHGVAMATRAGEATALEPGAVKGLPATALRSLSRWLPELPSVHAVCRHVEAVGDDLVLICHQVQPLDVEPPGSPAP
ncbi:hypothetical protein [Nocardioides salarius]|uniref:hypothetical protein n=1 Tax=Nocardioides salarius TaxID=374513 RepID=UPI0030F80978